MTKFRFRGTFVSVGAGRLHFPSDPWIPSGHPFDVRVTEIMKKMGDFIRVTGLALSAYLLLTIGTAVAASVLNLPYPHQASAVIVVTIFILGPVSILFVLPATILSVRLPKGSRLKKSQIVLTTVGTACSALAILWALVLWKMGPINPG